MHKIYTHAHTNATYIDTWSCIHKHTPHTHTHMVTHAQTHTYIQTYYAHTITAHRHAYTKIYSDVTHKIYSDVTHKI